MYNCLPGNDCLIILIQAFSKGKGKNMVNSDKIIDIKEIYKNVSICLIKPET